MFIRTSNLVLYFHAIILLYISREMKDRFLENPLPLCRSEYRKIFRGKVEPNLKFITSYVVRLSIAFFTVISTSVTNLWAFV